MFWGVLVKRYANRSMESNLTLSSSKFPFYFRNMGNFFFKLAFLDEAIYYKNGVPHSSTTVSSLATLNNEERKMIVAIINSTLFYYHWILLSDCYHLSKTDIGSFPIDLNKLSTQNRTKLAELCGEYLAELEKCAIWQIENKKDGTHKKYRRFFPQSCKKISDAIDSILAKHYGFTEEELDFIINYDIKYRMGKEL